MLALCGRLPCLDNSVVLICSTIQSNSAPYRHLAVASRTEAACIASQHSLHWQKQPNINTFHTLLLHQRQSANWSWKTQRKFTLHVQNSTKMLQNYLLVANCVNFTHRQQQQQQPFNGRLSGTTGVSRYQKKHSPAHTHPGQCTSFITFLHLQRSTASSLLGLRAWQSSRTTSFQVLFRLPLGLEPSTSYSMHFFTQSSSSFCSTYPYQCSLFCCNINAMSSTPSLSLNAILNYA